MISFIRRIYSDFKNKSRPSKFLIYASGEIFVIVIGIIFALMLNDWHDRRILQKEKMQFIHALIKDYELDSIILADYIRGNVKIHQQLSELNRRAYQPDANLDTIIHLAKYDYIPEFLYISNYNTTTLRTIESTGKIELFDVNLRTELLKHYQKQNLSLDFQKSHSQRITYKLDEYTNTFKIGGGFKIGDNYLSRLSWNIENEREFVVLFTEMIGINNLVVDDYIDQHREMLEETVKMISLLRNEQKKSK